MDHPNSVGDWPAVPPAPAPTRPPSPPLPAPDPPIINSDVRLIPAPPAAATVGPAGVAVGTVTTSVGTAQAPAPAGPAPTGLGTAPAVTGAVPAAVGTAPARSDLGPVDSSVPVTAVPAGPGAHPLPLIPAAPRGLGRTPRPLPPPGVPFGSEPTTEIHPVRGEVVWQPRFALWSAVVILTVLVVVTLPLWIVLFRLVGTPDARTADILALCMMLLGGFVAGGATWAVLVEMRGRIRMVDNLARGTDRELPVVHALDLQAPPVSAVAALEASSRLLSSFSGVLRSFGQLWAQVAMLAVALALFAGATLLSLP